MTLAPAASAGVIQWFVLRWQLEVTYHEVREHLGVETQRQWSDLAILRTTPALLALFSLVTLLAHQHARRRKLPIRQAAWYHKTQPTFSDALALVRRQIWQHQCFPAVAPRGDRTKLTATIKTGCFQPCVTRPDGADWIKSSLLQARFPTTWLSRVDTAT